MLSQWAGAGQGTDEDCINPRWIYQDQVAGIGEWAEGIPDGGTINRSLDVVGVQSIQ